VTFVLFLFVRHRSFESGSDSDRDSDSDIGGDRAVTIRHTNPTQNPRR
jgi:hypothetical protein